MESTCRKRIDCRMSNRNLNKVAIHNSEGSSCRTVCQWESQAKCMPRLAYWAPLNMKNSLEFGFQELPT